MAWQWRVCLCCQCGWGGLQQWGGAVSSLLGVGARSCCRQAPLALLGGLALIERGSGFGPVGGVSTQQAQQQQRAAAAAAPPASTPRAVVAAEMGKEGASGGESQEHIPRNFGL